MHLDNLLFILLIAVAALFRLLANKAGDAARKKSEPPPERSTFTPRADQPPPLSPADTDEERIRRFLEALGQPTSSKPPPPVVRRPTSQRRMVLPHGPPFSPPHPPLMTRPREEPTRKIPGTPPPTPPAVEPRIVTPAIQQAPIFEVQESALTAEQTAAQAMAVPAPEVQTATEQPSPNIAMLLRSPSGLRDAIVLREIFGPPRSLQPFDLL